jgi:poly(3-hydroxybutyrate) depolymerase
MPPRQGRHRRNPADGVLAEWHDSMLYQMYQAQADMLEPMRRMARAANSLATQPWTGIAHNPLLRVTAAAADLIGHTGTTHARPAFGIDSVMVGNRRVPVEERVAHRTPFGTLIHFAKDIASYQPKVLLVAPLSGHFSTLLRGTARTLVADHDLYITDWTNARDVPVSDGRFGFDDYVDHIIRFAEQIGPGGHMVAVCQPTVAVLVAASVMAQTHHVCQPRSITLMAGPLDTRLNPTSVNVLAKQKPIDWFEENLIGVVPWQFRGAGRRVYPGFVQLSAFVSMNLKRHVQSHIDQFNNVMQRETAKADAHRNFYDEYLAVMDLTSEFFLETVKKIFQDHDLPLGRLTWHGQKVEPAAIRRTFLFTVEGEQDDICAIGQTMAALDMCTGLRPSQKRHHLQTGVGHYGVFNGRRWNSEIYPKIREVIEFTSRTARH